MENEIADIRYMQFKPRGMGQDVWHQIVEAWANGLSDREAAFRVCKNTGKVMTESKLKALVCDDEDVSWLRSCLHNELLSQAKLNIKSSIDSGNVSTSKWYLERKAPDEFSSKAAVAFEGAITELSIEDKQRQMEEFMDQFEVEREDRSVLKVGEFPDE